MKKVSVANKNAFVLIMTIVPFILGVLFSLYKSGDMDYFGKAINISGSERMRTMLVATLAQKIEDDYELNDVNSLEIDSLLLEEELAIYVKYMSALSLGDSDLAMKENKYLEIRAVLTELTPLFEDYVKHAQIIIKDPSNKVSVDFIVNNSINLKNMIHESVEAFQLQYDEEVSLQRRINTFVLAISIILTILGLTLTKRLRENEFDATYDFLTGLKTRKVMFEEVSKLDSERLIVIFIDLDRFKFINDTYGHGTGDEILIAAANLFSKELGYEHVYRYAGDEFIVVQECKDKKNEEELCSNVTKTIENLKESFKHEFVDSNNISHQIGFSCGVVTYNSGLTNIYDIVELADDLMYDSKNYSSNIVICDSKEKANNRMTIKHKAKNALVNQEIIPYLQPIYEIYKEEVIGYEILARWLVDGNVYLPTEFMPIMIRNGMVEEFDLYMIRNIGYVYEILTQRIGKPLTQKIHINLSNKTLMNIETDRFQFLLEKQSIPLSQLVIEINDTVEDIKLFTKNINRFKQIGCSFALNDYSKDNRLYELLNKSFITYMRIERGTKALRDDVEENVVDIKNMFDYCDSKNKTCIAEAVESKQQFDLLRSCGIKNFQGYLFYDPIPITDIDGIIKTMYKKIEWKKFD